MNENTIKTINSLIRNLEIMREFIKDIDINTTNLEFRDSLQKITELDHKIARGFNYKA